MNIKPTRAQIVSPTRRYDHDAERTATDLVRIFPLSPDNRYIGATMSSSKTPDDQRIAKMLARAGIASRREVERMIAEGRIALNGTVLDTPATILTSLDGVTVDGNPVAAPTAARLFRYHKPAGLLTAERDFTGRPTIY